ncbi:MAG: hydroxymethylbilane synthase [Roseburia sp.]
MKYKIGTRGSKLALVQASYVCKRLQETYPQHEFEIKIIKTKGDLIQNKPLNQIGEKGLFVKEIEEQILADEVQIGVHSMKDMPAEPAKGLIFTKAWKREDPRDVLILREKKSLEELPEGAVIGTGSIRRRVQLQRLRSDLQVVDIRGNVDTRLRKMEEQKLDGIVLAAAGLHRLGLEHLITQYFETEEMIPAPAQGILALEIAKEKTELAEMLNTLSEEASEKAARAERGYLEGMGGDCHVPIGAVCKELEDGTLCLRTMFGDETGEKVTFAKVTGAVPEQMAKEAVLEMKKNFIID